LSILRYKSDATPLDLRFQESFVAARLRCLCDCRKEIQIEAADGGRVSPGQAVERAVEQFDTAVLPDGGLVAVELQGTLKGGSFMAYLLPGTGGNILQGFGYRHAGFDCGFHSGCEQFACQVIAPGRQA
jgi:hypothetical protein